VIVVPDLFYQTRPAAPYPAEAVAFADALEAIMADGTHDLGALAAGLNARDVRAGGHTAWTSETLSAYLAALANAA
jgi:hypothetical protein